MSRMKMDDIVFGRSLREPGYRVDFAAGTTYSLDLETFISLPFSLGFLEEPDEAMKKSLTYIFAALRMMSRCPLWMGSNDPANMAVLIFYSLS